MEGNFSIRKKTYVFDWRWKGCFERGFLGMISRFAARNGIVMTQYSTLNLEKKIH